MAVQNSPVIALMSIYPEFANGILSGRKKVEFRKTMFRKDVTHILIYATAPTQDVVGYFEVVGIESGRPEEIWDKYKHVSGLSRDAFMGYFKDAKTAIAIRVGRAVTLTSPIRLQGLAPQLLPPQNFRYLSEDMVRQLGVSYLAAPLDVAAVGSSSQHSSDPL